MAGLAVPPQTTSCWAIVVRVGSKCCAVERLTRPVHRLRPELVDLRKLDMAKQHFAGTLAAVSVEDSEG